MLPHTYTLDVNTGCSPTHTLEVNTVITLVVITGWLLILKVNTEWSPH